MKLQRLEDLYIRQLELIFSPPGLPLVAKADPKGAPTTTILIRGEAGAGKTTLALALAHAIARARKGVLLVLNTETAPVEVDAKAKILDIPRRQVLAWPARGKARKGSIVVQHIALAAGPDELDAESEPAPRPGLLDALWEMLRIYRDESPDLPPIVAVMIDGMLLTERDENTGPTRSDTAAFLQALETRGISTVMIEESAPKQTSWLPFVVDLVFELQFNTADDTRKLVRQLVCRKSRYTPAFAGPHEYDLDEDDVLAVWPDPLDIDPEILREISGTSEVEPHTFWPLNEEDNVWIWKGAGLLCTEVSSSWDVVLAMDVDPTSKPLTIILDEGESYISNDGIQPGNRGGIYAIIWSILRAARTRNLAAVVIHDLDRLIARAQSLPLFVRALRALLRSGFLVGVRGSANEIEKIRPYSTYTSAVFREAGKIKILRREGLSVERWFIHPSPFASLNASERGELSHRLARHNETKGALTWLAELNTTANPSIKELLTGIKKLAKEPQFSPALSILSLECLSRIDRSGESIADSISVVERFTQDDSRLGSFMALTWYLHGDNWRAAHAIIESKAISQPLARVIWNYLCARYTSSDTTSELLRIFAGGGTSEFPLDARRLAASSFVRIQHLRGTPTDARACIDTVAAGLEPWLVERWHAEIALESSDETVLASATVALHALAIDPTVPAIHQAEIFYNLALLAERQQRPADALTLCDRAQERNPAQEPTFQRLRTRLQSPAKPPLT